MKKKIKQVTKANRNIFTIPLIVLSFLVFGVLVYAMFIRTDFRSKAGFERSCYFAKKETKTIRNIKQTVYSCPLGGQREGIQCCTNKQKAMPTATQSPNPITAQQSRDVIRARNPLDSHCVVGSLQCLDDGVRIMKCVRVSNSNGTYNTLEVYKDCRLSGGRCININNNGTWTATCTTPTPTRRP